MSYCILLVFQCILFCQDVLLGVDLILYLLHKSCHCVQNFMRGGLFAWWCVNATTSCACVCACAHACVCLCVFTLVYVYAVMIIHRQQIGRKLLYIDCKLHTTMLNAGTTENNASLSVHHQTKLYNWVDSRVVLIHSAVAYCCSRHFHERLTTRPLEENSSVPPSSLSSPPSSSLSSS